MTWKKDDKLIWASYKYNVKTSCDTCILEVLNSDRIEAVGRYTCEISNAAGSDVCHANVKLGKLLIHSHAYFFAGITNQIVSSLLSVTSNQLASKTNYRHHLTLPLLTDFLEPVRFVKKLRNTFYKIGHSLTLECTFTGSQRIYVSWMKDGKPIWASYKYNVKTTDFSSILEVLNSDRREAEGQYSCEISNCQGTDICHAMVKIGKTTTMSHHHCFTNDQIIIAYSYNQSFARC